MSTHCRHLDRFVSCSSLGVERESQKGVAAGDELKGTAGL